jgi:Tol biopolymer transport system component
MHAKSTELAILTCCLSLAFLALLAPQKQLGRAYRNAVPVKNTWPEGSALTDHFAVLADAAFQRAVELAPNNAEAHLAYAQFLTDRAWARVPEPYYSQARRELARVTELGLDNEAMRNLAQQLDVLRDNLLPSGMLAYIQNGDVWVKELPNGEPRRLTTDGRNRSPRWSPSGEWIAFVKGDSPPTTTIEQDQLWVIRKSGADAQALNGGGLGIYQGQFQQFKWSSVSDVLAFTTATGDLGVTGPDEWRVRELFTNGSAEKKLGALSFAWSADGKWVAYGREDVLNAKTPPDLYAGLWRVRVDGTGAAQVFGGPIVFGVATPPPGTNPYGGAFVADWSNDGQQIFYWNDQFSGSLLADGTSLNSVRSGSEPQELVRFMLAYSDFLAASPDGKSLAVPEGGGRETWTNKHIVVVDPATGAKTQLTEDNVAAFSPAWSPDGEQIAYVAAPDIGAVGGGNDAKTGAAKRRIWIMTHVHRDSESAVSLPTMNVRQMNRDGSNKRQLTNDPAYRDERPLWSADGNYILFARLDNATDKTSLWMVPSTGGEPRRVVDELGALPPETTWFGYYGHIAWDDYFDLWAPATPAQSPNPAAAAHHSAFCTNRDAAACNARSCLRH